METLKPCPFCGLEVHQMSWITTDDHSHGAMIMCPCGLSMGGSTKEELSETWNARPQSEAERKIERVKEKLELLRKDAKMLDSMEHVAMDYVIDLTLEILEGNP